MLKYNLKDFPTDEAWATKMLLVLMKKILKANPEFWYDHKMKARFELFVKRYSRSKLYKDGGKLDELKYLYNYGTHDANMEDETYSYFYEICDFDKKDDTKKYIVHTLGEVCATGVLLFLGVLSTNYNRSNEELEHWMQRFHTDEIMNGFMKLQYPGKVFGLKRTHNNNTANK